MSYRRPTSKFNSPQELKNESVDNNGAFIGFLVITFRIPPTASDPYKVEAGPLTISTLSINACGIPVKP